MGCDLAEISAVVDPPSLHCVNCVWPFYNSRVHKPTNPLQLKFLSLQTNPLAITMSDTSPSLPGDGDENACRISSASHRRLVRVRSRSDPEKGPKRRGKAAAWAGHRAGAAAFSGG